MNREEICLQLTEKINLLKNKVNIPKESVPGVRLIYGTTPGKRTPVMYDLVSFFSFPGIKSDISMSACFVTTPMNTCC